VCNDDDAKMFIVRHVVRESGPGVLYFIFEPNGILKRGYKHLRYLEIVPSY